MIRHEFLRMRRINRDPNWIRLAITATVIPKVDSNCMPARFDVALKCRHLDRTTDPIQHKQIRLASVCLRSYRSQASKMRGFMEGYQHPVALHIHQIINQNLN